MKLIFISSAVLLVFLVTIFSCGRKGDPIPPEKLNAKINAKITPNNITDMSRGERR